MNNLFGSKEEMDCMKVLDMLDSILDGEVDVEGQKKFDSHIEKCMPCYERYNLDKSLKDLLRARCNNTQVPTDLVESIRTQINQAGTI